MNFRTHSGLLLAALFAVGCGTQGPTGPQGPAGPSGSDMPSVSGIVPAGVYLGRSAELTVSGFGTMWSSTTTVDFGAGITVTKTTAASATALLVEVTIAATAAIGPRDVTVTDGTNTEVYKGAFHVDYPVEVATLGTLAQGGLFQSTVRMLDLSTPFDTTSTGDGFFTPLVYTNLAANLTGGTGVTVSVSSVTETEVVLFGSIDLDATAAMPLSLTISSGPTGATLASPMPAFTVTARTATPLTAGAGGVMATLSGALDSALYGIAAPTNPTLYTVKLTAVSAPDPEAVLLPASGHWADELGVGQPGTPVSFIAQPAASHSLVVFGNTAGGTVTTALTTTELASTAQEDTAAVTSAKAQNIDSMPFAMLNGKTTGDAYQHWLKYTAVAGDIGKHFHVRTLPGDPQTDTVVELFMADGTTTFGGPSDDSAYHEDWASPNIVTAADYFIEVTWSSQSEWSMDQSRYDLVVTLE